MAVVPYRALVGFLVFVSLLAGARSESSTCFIETTQNYGFCKYGCCGVSLDANQRCCDPPDVIEWLVAVCILGGVLGITWIVCIICLVHKAIKNSKKVKIRVHPSKKTKKKKEKEEVVEKKTQFVNPTPEAFYTYPPQYEPPTQPSRLKSSLKTIKPPSEHERKERKAEAKLYPIKKNTEFTQVAYQPQSRSSGLPEWASANQDTGLRGIQNEAGRERGHFPPVPKTPESYLQ